jgi:hypothetical protein
MYFSVYVEEKIMYKNFPYIALNFLISYVPVKCVHPSSNQYTRISYLLEKAEIEPCEKLLDKVSVAVPTRFRMKTCVNMRN